MRVVHVVHRLSIDGGVQMVIRRLIDHLDPVEFELHLVSVRPPVGADRLDRLPVVLHTLDHRGNGYRGLRGLRLATRAMGVLVRCKPDLVHLHSGTAWLGVLARLRVRRAAFLLEVHDAPGSGRHGSHTDWFEGWMCRRLGITVLGHSSSVASEVRQGWRVPDDRLVVFPLAVDLARLSPDLGRDDRMEWCAAHGIPEVRFVMLAVGRLVRSKRFDRAIEALALLLGQGVDAQLVLVGDGPLADELEVLARNKGVDARVTRLHRLSWSDPEMVEAFRAADVLVSTSAYEGFGLTLVEGMAAGLPVVATAVGGVTDIVDHGRTGFLVPERDAAALVEHLRALAADRDCASSMGAASRQRAEQLYGVERMCGEYTELYRRLTRASGGSAVSV